MKWLITGGFGFVGSQLVSDVLSIGDSVCIIDNLSRKSSCSSHFHDSPKVKIIEADIRNTQDYEEQVSDFAPDYVVHLAALHYIPECNNDPVKTIDVNTIGTANLIAVCEKLKISSFILLSSGAIYSDSPLPLDESNPALPGDIYGISKLAAEKICLTSTLRRKVKIIRLFNVFGPGETNPHIIPEIADQLSRSTTLSLGNIDAVRDFIHVKDVSRALQLTAKEPEKSGVYNLSGNNVLSIRQLISLIQLKIGIKLSVEVDPKKYRPIDKHVQRADITKIQKVFDWTPKIKIEDVIQELIPKVIKE